MDGACDPKENLPGHPLSEGEQGSLILDCLVGPFAIELRRSTVAASGLIVGQELVPVSVNCQDCQSLSNSVVQHKLFGPKHEVG